MPSHLPRLCLVPALLAAPAAAQLEHGGVPPSALVELRERVPTETLRSVDVTRLLEEDERRAKGQPLRFGETIPVELASGSEGVWEELAGGGRVWRLRLESRGAHSLSLLFSRFQLPVGGELFVHDDGRSLVRGAYTHRNHAPNGGFAIQPIPGDALTLEYYEPAGADAEAELVLSGVVHDYRDVLALLKEGSGTKGACEVDVSCPEGDPWRDQIDATARILVGGSLCTGSLVNNTALDDAQLLLSANHCGAMNNAIFYFNYQRSGCASGGAPSNQTVQGSVQLATSQQLDYRLVRLTEPIPQSYDAYLAGWDRSGTTPGSTVTVHHPGGAPKKISFDHDPPQRSGSQWRIVQWDLGVTEPGSSGCPLYSPEGRFIGQLCCGAAACGFPFDDYYGRLDRQWSQIASHLDPLGSGVSTLDGRRLVSAGVEPLAVHTISPATIASLVPGTARTVTIRGTSFSAATTLSVDFVPVDPARYAVVDDSTIELDMVQTAGLGPRTVFVKDGGQVAVATIDVVAPAQPRLQVGNGDAALENLVTASAGLEVIVAGPPGETHWVLFSGSDLPSVLPLASLCLGNGFQELGLVALLTVGGAGWTQLELPLPSLSAVWFFQSLTLDQGVPVPVSNCQEATILPG